MKVGQSHYETTTVGGDRCLIISTVQENGVVIIRKRIVQKYPPESKSFVLLKTMFGKSVYEEKIGLRIKTLAEITSDTFEHLRKINPDLKDLV